MFCSRSAAKSVTGLKVPCGRERVSSTGCMEGGLECQRLGQLELGECKFETGWAPLFHVSAAVRATKGMQLRACVCVGSDRGRERIEQVLLVQCAGKMYGRVEVNGVVSDGDEMIDGGTWRETLARTG